MALNSLFRNIRIKKNLRIHLISRNSPDWMDFVGHRFIVPILNGFWRAPIYRANSCFLSLRPGFVMGNDLSHQIQTHGTVNRCPTSEISKHLCCSKFKTMARWTDALHLKNHNFDWLHGLYQIQNHGTVNRCPTSEISKLLLSAWIYRTK